MVLYDYSDSGNGYKARLLLALLDVPYELRELDIMAGATRTPEFLSINPNGRIPTLVLDDGTALPESNAILCYLADGTSFWPASRLPRAQVLQWLFFEQYSHEPYVATPRFILRHLPPDHPRRGELPARLEQGRAALGVMERQLRNTPFLVGKTYSIADIALYAYTHVADQAGLALESFPAVREWLARVAAHPGHIPMFAPGTEPQMSK
jgi:glutathione S-transferase